MSFWEWFADLINFSGGSVLTGLGALGAGGLALLGVIISTRQSAIRSEKALASAAEDRKQNAEQHRDVLERGRREQEALELREKEASRHERFSKVVEQLGSDKAAVRMGGLYSLSALADEWDQEARRLLGDDIPEVPDVTVWPPEMKRSVAPLNREYVDVAAQDAVGQRDACIGLVCAYLRAKPIATTRDEEWVEPAAPLPESNSEQPTVPPGFPDWDARTEAVAIIRRHLEAKAAHPWPGRMLNLDGADLRYQRLSRSHWTGASLNGAQLNHANLSYSQFNHTQLAGTHLNHVIASTTTFEGAFSQDAHFQHAQLEGANLQRNTMIGVDLRHADLNHARLLGSLLYGAQLEDSDFSHAEIGHPGAFSRTSFVPYKGSEHRLPSWNEGTQWPAGYGPDQLLAEHRQQQERAGYPASQGYA